MSSTQIFEHCQFKVAADAHLTNRCRTSEGPSGEQPYTENRVSRVAEPRLLEPQLAERVQLCAAPGHRDTRSKTTRDGCQRDDQLIIPSGRSCFKRQDRKSVV